MWQRALVPLQVNDNSCHVLSPSPEAIFLFLVETCERSKKAPASAGRWNPALLQKAVNRRTHSGDLNVVLIINKAKLLFWNLVWKTESISSSSFFFFDWGRWCWETFQQPEVSFPCGGPLHKISCQLILQLLRYVSAEQSGGLTQRHNHPLSCEPGRVQAWHGCLFLA